MSIYERLFEFVMTHWIRLDGWLVAYLIVNVRTEGGRGAEGSLINIVSVTFERH